MAKNTPVLSLKPPVEFLPATPILLYASKRLTREAKQHIQAMRNTIHAAMHPLFQGSVVAAICAGTPCSGILFSLALVRWGLRSWRCTA
jgi:hypothetical protein